VCLTVVDLVRPRRYARPANARARANGILGKSGADVDAYVKEVIAAELEQAGDEAVFRKIRKDFDAAGVNQSDHQIRRNMQEMLVTALAQLRDKA